MRVSHQRQDSNLQLPCGGWLTATWLAIRLTLVKEESGRAGPGHTVGHHRIDARRFRVPPGSRTLLAGLEDRVLAARTAVRVSSAPDLHRHVTRLQLAAYLFRSSGANERMKRRRRESNARDCRRPRCSKPACYHSSTSPMLMNGVPTRGLEPPEPAFVALAAIQLPWAWRPLRDSNPRLPIESREALPCSRSGRA